jgi:uncharacterized membrane protein
MSQSQSPPSGWNRTVWFTALVFAVVGALLQWWRMTSLTSSMDQGILYQILWNGLQGHPFESTLSSQLSTNVVHAGELPSIGYHRLGQHFTPILLLWLPLIAVLGPWTLPLLQVALISGAGLLLYQLAKGLVKRDLATMLTLAFYGANAVIGPMLGNFSDFSQLPLAVFALLLGLQQRRSWLIALAAIAIPLIREDTGVLLVGVGVWLAIRDPSRRGLAALLVLWGGGYVLLATNVLMPLFSADSSKRFMMENYGQFIDGRSEASSLEVLGAVVRKPLVLLQELIDPPSGTLRYMLGQGLPLLFVPFIAIDSWLLMGLPLLGKLLASGFNDPLGMNIRYTYLVVPGLFAGAVYWWSRHEERFASRRLRRLWSGCIVLSLMFALSSNPNGSLSWLVPDSISPWSYRSPLQQWQHSRAAFAALEAIPAGASVSASTPLIPHLAAREVLIRFPYHVDYNARSGQARPVDWIAIDLDYHSRHAGNVAKHRRSLEKIKTRLNALDADYTPQVVNDGVVILQRDARLNPGAALAYQQLRDQLP